MHFRIGHVSILEDTRIFKKVGNDMWTADNWKDYEVLDTSEGEKLERWGRYLLIRPDPQVIWQTEKTRPEWRKPNGHYHRSSKGGGSWEFFDLPKTWQISDRKSVV